MPREIIVAAAQMGAASLDKRENVDRMEALLDQAIDVGVQAMNFPELAFTTYFAVQPPPKDSNERDGYFHNIPDKLTVKLLSKARKNNVALIVPYAEKNNGNYYNSVQVFNGSGQDLGTYRKVHTPLSVDWIPGGTHLYDGEWFHEGDLGFPVFDIGIGKIGVLICYDRHMPEAARCLTLKGAEIIFICTNSPSYGSQHRSLREKTHDMILGMRAYENNVFVVSAEKGGVESGMDWLGMSAIVSPDTEFVACAKFHDRDELVWSTIDLDMIGEVRKIRNFLAERRPHCYGKIVENPPRHDDPSVSFPHPRPGRCRRHSSAGGA